MKKILSVILILLFIGCKKDTEKTCWYCTFGFGVGGSIEPPRTVCLQPWEDIREVKFVDQYNNDLTSICEKR